VWRAHWRTSEVQEVRAHPQRQAIAHQGGAERAEAALVRESDA
jgi:hypothetical protein